MTKRAAIYCRISRDPSGDMLGVQRQEQACRELCEKNGWTPVEPVYVDDDRSAYSGKPRPAYVALLAAVKAQDVDVVVAWAPDRLTRSMRELVALIDTLSAAKIPVETVQSGGYDLSTPSGQMSAHIVGSVAQFESAQKSARLRAKSAEIAATGRVGGGGTRPYGFNDDRRTLRRSEAKVVREVAARIVAGESIRGVVADLNNRNISTVSGKPWAVTSLHRILIAPRTAGLRQHQGQTIGKAEWTAILDETTHHQLRAILLDPERRTNTSARKYLLTGYVYCGLCEAKLVARPRSDKQRCYVCATGPGNTGCGKIRVLSEPLEDLVVAMIVEAVDSHALAAATTPESTGDDIETTAELQRIDSDMDALADDYAEGRVSREMFTKAAARLDARKVDAQRALSTSATADRRAGVLSDPMPLGERWPDMNFDQRRVVIDAVVERVVIGPAVKGRNFFDPDRVSIQWRA
jgi:site-specific DNA recombinase